MVGGNDMPKNPAEHEDSRVPADVWLVGIHRVAQILDVSLPTIRRLADAGKLPKPVHVGRSVRWRLSEIVDYSRGLKS